MTIVHLPPMRADLATRLHGIARATPDIARYARQARIVRRLHQIAYRAAMFGLGLFLVALIALWLTDGASK